MNLSTPSRPGAARGVFRLAAWVTLLAFGVSCATTKLPPISGSGAAFQPEPDEARLWKEAAEEEAKLRKAAKLYSDPLLEDYLGDVVQRINPTEMAANPAIDFRVTVLSDPTLNAFAYPTGSLYVHTGLLARMENEDQLATVLGHEMTHVENRHMLRFQRSARNKQLGFSIAAIAGAIVLAGEEGDAASQGDYGRAAQIGVLSDVLLGLGLTLAFVAAMSGYGRELEREADQGGFAKMASAGYDVRESPQVYRALLEDHGDSTKAEAFFFGSHPRLQERIEAAEQWAATHPDLVRESAVADQAAFRRRMRPVIREDARLNLDLGRLKLAADQLARVIEEIPEDAEAHALMGQVKVKMAEAAKSAEERNRLRADAAESFREAIRLEPKHAAAHRELGVLAYREKDYVTACTELAAYLDLVPQAADAQTARDYLLELRRDGHCR